MNKIQFIVVEENYYLVNYVKYKGKFHFGGNDALVDDDFFRIWKHSPFAGEDLSYRFLENVLKKLRKHIFDKVSTTKKRLFTGSHTNNKVSVVSQQ